MCIPPGREKETRGKPIVRDRDLNWYYWAMCVYQLTVQEGRVYWGDYFPVYTMYRVPTYIVLYCYCVRVDVLLTPCTLQFKNGLSPAHI
jgi:hypothetical protein